VEPLSFNEVIDNGFTLLPDDEKNKQIFAKARIHKLEIRNNFQEWLYYHNPPHTECDGF
jgi:hypothetical protein